MQAVPAVSVKNPGPTGIIPVAQDVLQGVYNKDKSVEVYTVIPYAKPPVGELRRKEDQDPDKWDGVQVAGVRRVYYALLKSVHTAGKR